MQWRMGKVKWERCVLSAIIKVLYGSIVMSVHIESCDHAEGFVAMETWSCDILCEKERVRG